MPHRREVYLFGRLHAAVTEQLRDHRIGLAVGSAEHVALFGCEPEAPVVRVHEHAQPGRLTTPSRAASASYRSPLVKADELGCCCGGKVTARVEELDFYQEHPYGTRVWQKSYNRRNVAEAAIGKLKAKKGLGGEACQAFGITANTMAAVAAVVAYNRTKAKAVKRTKKAQARRKATAKAQQRSAGAAMRAAAATDATKLLSRDQRIPASGAETPPRAPP